MYKVEYTLVTENHDTAYKIECERLEEAQLVWDTLLYLRNQYAVTSRRPA